MRSCQLGALLSPAVLKSFIYIMTISPGDFNAKVGREDILKPTIRNENILDISNDNGVRVVNFVIFKNFIFKSRMFSRRNI
jgi:hypothetical protein